MAFVSLVLRLLALPAGLFFGIWHWYGNCGDSLGCESRFSALIFWAIPVAVLIFDVIVGYKMGRSRMEFRSASDVDE